MTCNFIDSVLFLFTQCLIFIYVCVFVFDNYENEESRYGAKSTRIPYIKYGPTSVWNCSIDVDVLGL